MLMKQFEKLRALDEIVKAQTEVAKVETLNLNRYPAPQLLHERSMARRRRELTDGSDDMFKLTSLKDLPIDEDVPTDELEADKMVSHKRLIIVDKDYNVVHGHEAVLKAIDQGETSVSVLRICQKISERTALLFQVRHAAKEGMLFPAIRMEAIRIMADEYGLQTKQMQLLLVGPKGKKPSAKEVTSELGVGRLFERYPGYQIPFTGYELDKHSFSNLKYLVGNNTIFEQMSKSPDHEQHFLRMAINATKTRSKRLNTEIPPLMIHPDTKDKLFNEGLPQAKDLHRAKYPEDNIQHHPQNDLVAANEKLNRTETLVLLKKQLEENPSVNPVFKQVQKLNSTISEISDKARIEILRGHLAEAPELFAQVLIEGRPELAVKGLTTAKSKYEQLLMEVL